MKKEEAANVLDEDLEKFEADQDKADEEEFK